MREGVRSPVLSGGISNQPAHVRFPEQVADATNALFTAGVGASKRPGSELIAAITSTFGAAQSLRGHAIDRDGAERYVVYVGRNAADTATQLEVFDASDGTKATVTVSADAQAYLDAGSPAADDFRLVTIGDTTVIVNRKATPAVGSSPSYSIADEREDYSALLAFTPDDGDSVRTLNDEPGTLAGFYEYGLDRDNADDPVTFAKGRGPTVGQDFAIASEWANQANPGGFTIFFQRVATVAGNYSWDHTTFRLTRAGAFANYTGATDDQVNITGGTGVSVDSYPIKAKISDDTIELFGDITAGSSPVDVTIDGIGLERQVEGSFTSDDPVPADMDAVAQRWQDGLRAAGVEEGLIAWIPVSGTQGYFEITGPYRGVGSKVHAPFAPALAGASFIDYTDAATEPFSNAGWTGTDGTGVQSEVPASHPVAERWTRKAAPAQAEARITATTMPVLLTRTGLGPPPTFDVSTAPWNDRTSGDRVSNPAPRIITESAEGITDAAFLQGRLWLSSGEFIQASRADDLFNLFVTDPGNVADDDPIDAQVSSDQFAAIDALVPFNRGLTVFTFAGRQFDVSGTGVITPSTVTITPSARYDTKGSRPVVMGSFVYFLTDGEGATDVWEYAYDEQILSTVAAPLTRHVNTPSAKLLPAGVSRMEAAPSRGTLVALEPGEDCLFVWRGAWNGGRKVQSAWCKWDFDDTYEILDASVLAGDAYLLVRTGSQYTLERLPLEQPEAQSPGAAAFPYPVHLDRWVSVTGSYSAGPDETTFDLGDLVATGSTINAFVRGPDFDEPGRIKNDNQNWTYDAANGEITVSGDFSDGEVIMGRSFTLDLELSRPYRRETTGQDGVSGVVHDRCFVRRTALELARVGEVQLITSVSADAGSVSDRVRAFDSGIGTVTASATLSTNLGGRTDQVTFSVTSPDARPAIVVAAEWQMDFVEGQA